MVGIFARGVIGICTGVWVDWRRKAGGDGWLGGG